MNDRMRSLLLAADRPNPTGARLGDLMPGAAEQVSVLVRRVLETGEEFRRIDVVFHMPAPVDRRRVWQTTWGPLRDANGRARGVLLAAEDVTELRASDSDPAAAAARLRRAMDHIPAMLWFTERNGVTSFCNRRVAEYCGETPAATFAGRVQRLHPEDQDRVLAARLRALAAGTPLQQEARIQRHDGAWRWHRVSMEPVPGGARAPTMFVGLAVDIHDLKRASAALAVSEERLKLAGEAAGVGVWDWDVASGRIAWTPDQWRLHGLRERPDSPSFADWEQAVHPDDRERVKADVMAALADPDRAFDTDYRVIHGDGSVRWLLARGRPVRDAQGSAVRLIGINMDVTASREVEAALRASEARLRLAHQLARTGGFEWRIGEPDAVVTEQYAEIAGLPPGTTRDPQSRAFARIVEEDRAEFEAVVRRVLENGAPAYETEFRIRRELDGLIRRLVVRAEVSRDGFGRAERLVGVVRDVTAERVAQAELERLNADLAALVRAEITARESAQSRAAHAERVQALGQLAGGIAHDFNNVLQAVQGGAAMIERRPDDPDAVLRFARMVKEATGRGAAVTRRLLAFARRDELQAAPLDPLKLLHSLHEVLSHTLGPAVDCRVETPATLPLLMADRGQLETALVNLATNARDAMPDGGILIFRAAAETVTDPAQPGISVRPGRYIRLSVSDTGVGMDAATLARIGEPFFTTKPLGKGTGLGLSMVRGFAEQSGGMLFIESVPARGTVVSILLPQAPAQLVAEAAPAAATPVHEPGNRATPRVLLADDDDLVREAIASQLEAAGYVTLHAADGVEALALINAGEEIDVLVSDLAMPGIGGLALIRQAQETRPGLPAVLLTGYAGDGAALAVSGALSGTYSLMRKPVSGSQLVDRIAALLEVRSTAGA